MYGYVQSISIFFSLKGALSKILNVPELSMLLDFIDKNGRGFKVPEIYLPQVRRRIEVLLYHRPFVVILRKVLVKLSFRI